MDDLVLDSIQETQAQQHRILLPDQVSSDDKFAVLTLMMHFLSKQLATRKGLAEAAKLDPTLADGARDARRTRPIENLINNFSCAPLQLKKLRDFLVRYYTTGEHFYSTPAIVQQAVRQLKGERSDRENHPSAQIDIGVAKVISEFADSDQIELGKFSDNISANWHMVRYAAHYEQDHQPLELKNGGWDAYMVHAAVEFCRPVDGARYPSFQLRYRPNKSGRYKVVTGSAIPLAKRSYMHLIGIERHSGHPFSADVKLDRSDAPDLLYGLVTRKHDEGDLISGRFALIRTAAGSLDALNATIGQKLESAFRTEFEEAIADLSNIIENLKNMTPFHGKSCLRLP